MSAQQPEDTSRQKALALSYTIASQQLREAHADEFAKLRQAAAKDLGHDWAPKPTAKEKAREVLRQILNENPELREEIAQPE